VSRARNAPLECGTANCPRLAFLVANALAYFAGASIRDKDDVFIFVFNEAFDSLAAPG